MADDDGAEVGGTCAALVGGLMIEVPDLRGTEIEGDGATAWGWRPGGHGCCVVGAELQLTVAVAQQQPTG